MNRTTVAARSRAAQSLTGLARSLMLLLALVLGANVAAAQNVGFDVAVTPVTEGGSVTITAKILSGGALTSVGTVDYEVTTKLGACQLVGAETPQNATVDDFVVASGTLNFSVGATSRTISVQTLDDSIREKPENDKAASECFKVHLSNPGGGISALHGGLSNQFREILIKDNEADPTLSVSDASGSEAGGFASVALTLSNPIDVPLSFNTNSGIDIAFSDITTEGGNPVGGAPSDDNDYNDGDGTGLAAYGVILPAGSTSATLQVQLVDDVLYEGDERFNVQIAADPRYTLADAVGVVTIVDNESIPVLEIESAAPVTETGTLMFDVRPSVAAEANYTALFSYQDVSATSALDYSPVNTLVITSAATPNAPAVLSVPTLHDTEIEGPEAFLVSILDDADYNVTGGVAGGLIQDDDGVDLSIAATNTGGSNNPGSIGVTTTSATYEFTVTNTDDGNAQASDPQIQFSLIGLSVTGHTGCAAFAAGVCDVWVAAGELLPGESRTVTLTANVTALAGETASVEALVGEGASVSVLADLDLKNNEARVLTDVYGVDFGDFVNVTGASHLLADDLILGDLRDSESTSQTPALTADGDDSDGLADEDGLFIATQNAGGTIALMQDAPASATVTNYIGVYASDSGFLNVFGEYQDGASSWYALSLPDVAVAEGLNWIAIDVESTTDRAGTGTGVLLALRLRLCSAAGVCNSASAANVFGGEIEDHAVNTMLPTDAVAFEVPAEMVQPITVANDGTNYVVRDGNGKVLFSRTYTEADGTTELTLLGSDGPDTFVVDLNNVGNKFDVEIDGRGGSDNLEVLDTGASPSWDEVTHVALGPEDGDLEYLDTGIARIDIFYRNFAPVLDQIIATDRFFEFSDAIDDNIVIRDNGSDSDGFSFIDSNGSEQITFKNPTGALKVWAGLGADSFDFQGLDETDGAGNPSTTVISLYGHEKAKVGADLGDTFVIAPLSGSSSLSFSEIHGGAPGLCLGDVLDVNTANGVVIDTIDEVGKQITFSSAHQQLTFDEIEHFADFVADVKLSLILPPTPATNPGDILPIQLLVENNGPATADCIKINDVLLDGALTITDGPTFSQGSFNSPMWVVGSLAPGASATLTYEVEVGYQFNGEAAITALAPQEDPNLDNNSVTLDIQPAFPFPVKAQATAALWYDHDGDVDTDNRLMVGLANGYAGLTSAVLCRVPNFGGVFSDDLPLWRECGAGLPYPLYVTDLMQVETTDPDDKDLIYLTAWGSDGLYVSTDGGESFSAVNPNVSDTHVAGWTAVYAITEDADGFLYISTNHGFVFRSLNKGVSWQQIGSLPEVDADTPWSLTSHPTEGGRIYAGTFGRGVYTSDDYGFTWEFVGGKAVNDLLIAARGGHAFDLELDPTGDFLFVGTGKGVFRMSLDGVGASTGLWTSLDMEVELSDGSKVTPEVRSLAFDMNGHLYATTWGFGAFRNPAPTLTPSIDFVKIALRGQEIAFVAISTDGSQVAFGSMGGGVELVEALAASATDTESESANTELPDGYALNQNYPNPFNPVTTISFALPETGMARLAVYDILGREVAVLVDGNLQAGQHSMQFDAQGLPTGTYIYRLETDKASFARQLVLMK